MSELTDEQWDGIQNAFETNMEEGVNKMIDYMLDERIFLVTLDSEINVTGKDADGEKVVVEEVPITIVIAIDNDALAVRDLVQYYDTVSEAIQQAYKSEEN